MSSTVTRCHRGYRFGFADPLDPDQCDALIAVFRQPEDPASGVLGGRRAVRRIDLDGIGPVVVKTYARGGAIRHFNRQTHIRWGAPRGAREMEWLQRVRNLGICVPCPVAWADSGGRFFYRCWLAMRALPESVSLAQLALQDPARTAAVFPAIRRQMAVLIENRIHHRDLHPGNILVDDRENAYFIDFDKAKRRQEGGRRLAGAYLRRWRRAVAKYGLPRELDLLMADAVDRRWTK